MKSTLDRQIESAEKEWLELWKKGPTRLRWNKVPLQVGDLAPDVELQDTSGKSVHLRDFWLNGPALIMFWSCLLYTSPSPRDKHRSRMPSSA